MMKQDNIKKPNLSVKKTSAKEAGLRSAKESEKLKAKSAKLQRKIQNSIRFWEFRHWKLGFDCPAAAGSRSGRENSKQTGANVIPVKTGIQSIISIIDSRFRGNDKGKFRAAGNWKFVSLTLASLVIIIIIVSFSLLPQSARSKTFTFFQMAKI